MKRGTLESYKNVVEQANDPAALIAAIGGEIRKMQRYRAQAMRESLAGVRLAILNYLSAEHASAKVRAQIMGAPLSKEE